MLAGTLTDAKQIKKILMKVLNVLKLIKNDERKRNVLKIAEVGGRQLNV